MIDKSVINKPLPEMTYKELCAAIVVAWRSESKWDMKRLCEYYKSRFGHYPTGNCINRWELLLSEESSFNC